MFVFAAKTIWMSFVSFPLPFNWGIFKRWNAEAALKQGSFLFYGNFFVGRGAISSGIRYNKMSQQQ